MASFCDEEKIRGVSTMKKKIRAVNRRCQNGRESETADTARENVSCWVCRLGVTNDIGSRAMPIRRKKTGNGV